MLSPVPGSVVELTLVQFCAIHGVVLGVVDDLRRVDLAHGILIYPCELEDKVNTVANNSGLHFAFRGQVNKGPKGVLSSCWASRVANQGQEVFHNLEVLIVPELNTFLVTTVQIAGRSALVPLSLPGIGGCSNYLSSKRLGHVVIALQH